MTQSSFDPSVYTSLPPISLSSLVILARTLEEAAPRGLPSLPQRALAKVVLHQGEAQSALAARQRTLGTPTESVQAVDSWADRGVGAIRQRLEAFTLLPEEDYPQAARAGELLTLLFPEGLAFLNLPYIEQLAAMEVLLQRITDENLARELDTLCGREFLQNLRTLVPRYRDMVQGGLRRLDSSENLVEHRRRLSLAVVDYAIKVAALYDEDDPRSLDRIRSALRPIDALREQAARRLAGTRNDVDPDVPAPIPDPLPPDAPPPLPPPAPAPVPGPS